MIKGYASKIETEKYAKKFINKNALDFIARRIMDLNCPQ